MFFPHPDAAQRAAAQVLIEAVVQAKPYSTADAQPKAEPGAANVPPAASIDRARADDADGRRAFEHMPAITIYKPKKRSADGHKWLIAWGCSDGRRTNRAVSTSYEITHRYASGLTKQLRRERTLREKKKRRRGLQRGRGDGNPAPGAGLAIGAQQAMPVTICGGPPIFGAAEWLPWNVSAPTDGLDWPWGGQAPGTVAPRPPVSAALAPAAAEVPPGRAEHIGIPGVSIFKPSRRSLPQHKWLIGYREDGKRKVKSVSRDIQVTCQYATELSRRLEQNRLGLRSPGEERWIQTAKTPLAELLEDYVRALLARGRTSKHAQTARFMATRVFEKCGARRANDITPSAVQRAIATLKPLRPYWRGNEPATAEGKDLSKGHPLSAQTRNHYLAVIGAFFQRLVKDGRLRASPSHNGHCPLQRPGRPSTPPPHFARRVDRATDYSRRLRRKVPAPEAKETDNLRPRVGNAGGAGRQSERGAAAHAALLDHAAEGQLHPGAVPRPTCRGQPDVRRRLGGHRHTGGGFAPPGLASAPGGHW